MQTVINLLPYLLGAYELLSHTIPTKKNWSIVHKVFSLLKTGSDLLNRQKPWSPNSNLPKIVLVAVVSMFVISCATVKRTKIDCISQTTVPVVFIDNKGHKATLNIPFCDTVRVEVLPDTTNKIPQP